VAKLRDDLGGDYAVLQSRHTILLHELPAETARWLLDYAGRAATTVRQSLGELAWGGAPGKNVALVFSEQDDYYQYLSHYSPDGEQAATGGVCVYAGYIHIALPWADKQAAANAIVHELTHACVAHLAMPLWLNEGITVTLEKAIGLPPRTSGQSDRETLATETMDWRPPIMWDELAGRHFSFWNEENIQSFWAGTSFYQPGDANELSYSLAEVLVKLLSERGDPAALHAFLEAARPDDAGQTAAMDIFRVDLGEIAATFLGEGKWRPDRKAMIACWEAAGWERRA
jgi:hypothetical protein